MSRMLSQLPSEMPSEMPTQGQQALNHYWIRQKIRARTKIRNRRLLSNIVYIWQVFTVASVERRKKAEASSERIETAILHWKQASLTKGLGRLRWWAKVGKARGQVARKGSKFFSRNLQKKAFAGWAFSVMMAKGERIKVLKAVAFCNGKLLECCFKNFRENVDYMKKLSHAVNFCFRSTLFRTFGLLKKWWERRIEKLERLEMAENWRGERMVWKGIGRWRERCIVLGNLQSDMMYAEAHWNRKKSRAGLVKLRRNVDRVREETKKMQMCLALWRNTLLENIWKGWVRYVGNQSRWRRVYADADAHYFFVGGQRFFDGVRGIQRERGVARRLCLVGEDGWASFKRRQFFKRFKSRHRDVVVRRKMTAVCVAFNRANVGKMAFLALKNWCGKSIECERNAAEMKKRLEMELREKTFNAWAYYAKKILADARLVLQKWHNISHMKHCIRRITKWWRNGGLGRCIESWKRYVLDCRGLRAALKFWLNLTMMKCIKSWKMYVVEGRNLKRAEFFWEGGLLRKSFGMLRLYGMNRGLKRRARERGGGGGVVGGKRKGLREWRRYVEEVKRSQNLMMKAYMLLTGNIRAKMFNCWRRYVESCVKVRAVVGVMKHGVMKRCIMKLRIYVERRAKKYELRRRGEEFWRGKAKKRVVLVLREGIGEEARNRRLLVVRVLGYFRNSLLAKCVRSWQSFSEEQKVIRHVVAFFRKGVVKRCVGKWILYVRERAEKKRARSLGEVHWGEVRVRKGLRRWKEFLEKRVEYKRIMMNAASWLVESSLKRCYLMWVWWVKEQKGLRHAWGIFSRGVVAKCFRGWLRWVGYRRERGALKSLGEEFYERRGLRTGLLRMRGNVEENRGKKKLLKKARFWFSNILLYKVFGDWKEFCRLERVLRKARGMFARGAVFKTFCYWRKFVFVVAAEKDLMRKAVVLYELGLAVRCVCRWKEYVRRRTEKAGKEGGGGAFYERKTLLKGMKKWGQEVVRMRERRDRGLVVRVWRESKQLGGGIEGLKAFVARKRQLRKAVRWCCDGLARKTFRSWCVFVCACVQEREMKEVADSYLERRLVKKVILSWREETVDAGRGRHGSMVLCLRKWKKVARCLGEDRRRWGDAGDAMDLWRMKRGMNKWRERVRAQLGRNEVGVVVDEMRRRGILRRGMRGFRGGVVYRRQLEVRVCEERSDELKRREYWISMYMPDTSKCNVAATKF